MIGTEGQTREREGWREGGKEGGKGRERIAVGGWSRWWPLTDRVRTLLSQLMPNFQIMSGARYIVCGQFNRILIPMWAFL